MKKQIRLNAFAMNCVAHQSPGLWTHPRDRTAEYNRLPYWIDLASGLRSLNRPQSLPHLLRCAEVAGPAVSVDPVAKAVITVELCSTMPSTWPRTN